jgi:hypothetical protein
MSTVFSRGEPLRTLPFGTAFYLLLNQSQQLISNLLPITENQYIQSQHGFEFLTDEPWLGQWEGVYYVAQVTIDDNCCYLETPYQTTFTDRVWVVRVWAVAELPEWRDLDFQLYMAKGDGNNLKYIPNPSPEVKLLALRNNGMAIYYIDNPSTEEQVAAVTQNGLALQFIPEPVALIIETAIRQNGQAIQYVTDPSLDWQRLAVQQNAMSLIYLHDPDLEIQILAIQKMPHIIQYIPEPSIPLQLLAVRKNPCTVYLLNNPTTEVSLAALWLLSHRNCHCSICRSVQC